jgi:uncharacterized YigZ family protein
MYTINKTYEYTQEIKKSTFTCTLIPVNSIEEVNENLKQIRKKYYDATHNCYSYVITNKDGTSSIKASDDGEPSQTAGVVILDVLQKNDLTNVLAVVTRYFGGIKLGAGGLVRAYSSSTSGAVKTIEFVPIIKMIHINIKFDYSYANEILKLFRNYKEVDSKYETNISLTYEIPEDDKDFLKEKLITITKNQTLITFINE